MESKEDQTKNIEEVEKKTEDLNLGEEGENQETGEKKKKKKKKNKNKGTAEGEGENEEEKKDTQDEQKVQEKKEGEEGGDDSDGAEEGGEKKKKKKKKNKKKKGGADPLADVELESRFQDNSAIRNLGNWQEGKFTQTFPPTITITQQFPNEDFPAGEIMEHPGDQNMRRATDKEFKQKDLIHDGTLWKLRKSAEAHRQVRRHAQKIIRPGKKIIDVCEEIEATNRLLIEANGIEQGIAFPTGASFNHCAAHYTPNPGDNRVIGKDDVIKIDFGTHVQGILVDCAFTVAFNPVYDNLLMAVKDATNTGIKAAGIDVTLAEVGESIQEVMESYEVTIGNTTYPVKSVRNLCGHSIGPYNIHAGKSVPIVKGGPQTRMEEGEVFAIETFGSTGKGMVVDDLDCSHYMLDYNYKEVPLRNGRAKALLEHIKNNFSTLAWCRRWIEEAFPRHIVPLKALVDSGMLKAYPPLSDIPGCYVAQYEHTIFLKPSGKEVITRGDDY